jgi:hypothetical protein
VDAASAAGGTGGVTLGKEDEMVIRILEEGKSEVPAVTVHALDRFYGEMAETIRADDAEPFARSLSTLLSEVRSRGAHLGTDRFGEFAALLPPKESTVEDARIVAQVVAQLRAGLMPG